FGNADLANGIRHRHALAAQNLNLPKLRDDLVGLVSLVCHCGPPSWSKPYFKVDPFNGGGSGGIDKAWQQSSCGRRSRRPSFVQRRSKRSMTRAVVCPKVRISAALTGSPKAAVSRRQ